MTSKVKFIQETNEPVEEVKDSETSAVLSGDMDVTPENIVKMTQVVRTGILREITDHGSRLPTDDDGVKVALAIMRDMDHTALTTSKLVIEERNASNAAHVASLADTIISKLNMGNTSTGHRIDESAIDLPDIELMEGESDLGEVALNPDEWLADRD